MLIFSFSFLLVLVYNLVGPIHLSKKTSSRYIRHMGVCKNKRVYVITKFLSI